MGDSIRNLEPLQRHAVMRALAAAPGLLAELDITLSRGDAVGPARVGGYARAANRELALPYHKGASDARADLTRELATFTRQVALLTRRPPPHTSGGRARYLLTYLPGLPDDSPAIAGINPAIPAAVDLARQMIDREPERICVGACGCGHPLDALEAQDIVECLACGSRYPVTERRAALLTQARDMVGTATELARILPWFSGKPITADAIRHWAARGKLTGHRRDGELVYRIGDVLRVHQSAATGQSRSVRAGSFGEPVVRSTRNLSRTAVLVETANVMHPLIGLQP